MKLWELSIALQYSRFRYHSQPNTPDWLGIFLSNLDHQKAISFFHTNSGPKQGNSLMLPFTAHGKINLFMKTKHRKNKWNWNSLTSLQNMLISTFYTISFGELLFFYPYKDFFWTDEPFMSWYHGLSTFFDISFGFGHMDHPIC